MGDKNTSRLIPLLSATLTIVGSFVAYQLTSSLTDKQSWGIVLAWMAAGIVVTYLLSRLQARASERGPEAIKERVGELESELREQVQIRSYGARRDLIEDPLEELGLDVEPRVGWVRDPRLVRPASEKPAGIVAAFDSSERRLLIVGEPGAGKTMAAYSLVEYLDKTEGDERTPLLVNLSAWEAQETFEAFLVDYLCSSVGYRVSRRAVALDFVRSRRYGLILDGLDEIPAGLRTHFSERLDGFMRGVPREVAVVVTCRTQEYGALRKNYPKGLGLVQAVEILPLSEQQLDRAFVELAKRDEGWETFLSQRHLRAYQRVRAVLSTPLFLNLAVVGHLGPGQLLDCAMTEQKLRDLVLERYLDRTLADQRRYEPADARRYLSWVARFLNKAEVSPFGLKTQDPTVFDFAGLTPSDPPRGRRLVGGLFGGLLGGLIPGLVGGLVYGDLFLEWLFSGIGWGLFLGLFWELSAALLSRWTSKRSALSARLTFGWSTSKAIRGLIWGLGWGSILGLFSALVLGLFLELSLERFYTQMFFLALVLGLVLALVLGIGWGLVDTRPELIASRTLTEARSRSLITALILGLVTTVLVSVPFVMFSAGTSTGPSFNTLSSGPLLGFFGLFAGLSNGGWFVLLQKAAERRLARAGKLPARSGDFLEWGIENHIFRRIGGGVRFRHDFIQQHLANTTEDAS